MFFLILAIVVVLFGLGVVVVNRRRERRLSLERARPTEPPVARPTPVEVLEPEAAPVAEPRSRKRRSRRSPSSKSSHLPRFRDRLGKARAALAGAFASVRARGGITDETWDDLEEALAPRRRRRVAHHRPHRRPSRAGQGQRAHDPRRGARRAEGRPVRTARRRRPHPRARRRSRASPACGCSSASTAWARPPRSARSARARSQTVTRW